MTITPGHPMTDAQKAKRWALNNPEKVKEIKRRTNLKKKFGLTIEQYEEMLTEQQGVCKICGCTCDIRARLSVDHCHSTDQVRGLLCAKCNSGLGFFRDNLEFLKNAVKYLESDSIEKTR